MQWHNHQRCGIRVEMNSRLKGKLLILVRKFDATQNDTTQLLLLRLSVFFSLAGFRKELSSHSVAPTECNEEHGVSSLEGCSPFGRGC